MSDVQPGPGWWYAADGRWYPPEARPYFASVPPVPTAPPVPPQPAGRRGRRDEVLGLVFGITTVAGLSLVVYVATALVALGAIGPRVACGQVVPLDVRVVTTIEAVVPLLLGVGAAAVGAVAAHRRRFVLLTGVYGLASALSVVLLVIWIVLLADSSTVGQQAFCDIAP